MSDYMSYVATPFFVLDKIVIQLYSRIFELRLCMLLDNKYWVAKIGDKPENCDIKLAFFGKLRFEDMVRMPKKCPPLYLNPLVVVDEDDNGNQKQSQHHTGCAPSEVVDLSTHSNNAHISAASTATQQCEPPEIIDLSSHSKDSCISAAITSTQQCADPDIIDLSTPSKDSQVAGASNLNKDSQESSLPVNMGAPLVSANSCDMGALMLDVNKDSQESRLPVNMGAPLVSANSCDMRSSMLDVNKDSQESRLPVNMGAPLVSAYSCDMGVLMLDINKDSQESSLPVKTGAPLVSANSCDTGS